MITGITDFGRGLLAALGEKDQDYAINLHIDKTYSGIALEYLGGTWTVGLQREQLLARALMLVKENANKPIGFTMRETPAYARLGVMLDCSRGAVPSFASFSTMLCALARMGYSFVQMYMEDVFELAAYPYFGLGRGSYSKAELCQMNDFAASLGIELVPSVQTLAHLGQSLKWKAMNKLVDYGDILLIDDDETYALIDAIFAMMASCFTSRRINIGMDEAHMVGLGKYLDIHGYTNRTELMLRHFTRVQELARKHGFSTMLWSDMFFRLASGGDYYAPDSTIDPAVAQQIPPDASLVYWDYYSEDAAMYDAMLQKHALLTPNVIFAGGAWKWTGFGPANAFSTKLAQLAHTACQKHGVQEVIITMWGDNGAECSMFAVLPTLQYWAELCYTGSTAIDGKVLASRFAACTHAELSAFNALDSLSFTPNNPSPGRCSVNPPKYLLYEDILYAMFSEGIDASAYSLHFASCARELSAAKEMASEQYTYIFDTLVALCNVLRQKCAIQGILRKAWASETKDKAALALLAQQALPELSAGVNEFITAFHVQWLTESKAAGLDVFDLRIGGLLQRIATATQRINAYLTGEIATIEELDLPRLPFDASEAAKGHTDIPTPFWHSIASPSNIAMI